MSNEECNGEVPVDNFTTEWKTERAPDFSVAGGLVPAIIQHAKNLTVLMLGYMNQEAFEATRATKRVTFFSRSRQTLWQKG